MKITILMLITSTISAFCWAGEKDVISASKMTAPLAVWKPQSAKWIWLKGNEKPGNDYVQFRKSFKLESEPNHAVIHISADCRYLLFINGQIVGRGPVTANPRYKQIDIYNVKQFFKTGENVISALVLQRNNKTSRLWPVRGGFILQLDTESNSIGTDASWRARWAIEYKSDTPYMTMQYGQQEWVDGRLIPTDWQETGFDDSNWLPALEVENAEKFWPTELELRTVPYMLREIIYPRQIVSFFGISSEWSPKAKDPANQIEVDYVLSSVMVRNPENITDPSKGPVIFQENFGDGVGFVVDLGEEMLGYPFIELECPAGITVDIGHSEALCRNRVDSVVFRGTQHEQLFADRYITRDGRQRFEIYDTKGCRYLEFHCSPIPKNSLGFSEIKIHNVGFVRSHAPIEQKTEFECSDKLLNQIFTICRRTADVKCQDWYICDAQREQNRWIEPFQGSVYLQAYGKVELIRSTIEAFAREQFPSGIMPSTSPSIFEVENVNKIAFNQYIFSTFGFPFTTYLDWLYGGKDNRQNYWLDVSDRCFDSLLKYLGPDGVLVNMPGSQFVEWSALDTRPSDCSKPVKKSSEVTFYNVFMVLVLERAAEMAETEGRSKLAAKWRDKADSLREAANKRYYSEKYEAYIDGIYDGIPSESVSQTTNAMAILARLGSPQRLEKIIKTIKDPQHCPIPCTIATMSFYNEALESMDSDDDVLSVIRSKWGKMLEMSATTTWESAEALERNQGCCFGFSAHPLNYMVRNYLGIIPLEPGYKSFSIRLKPDDLSFAKGKVAMPNGYIEVQWQRKQNIIEAVLKVPENCQAILVTPRVKEWKDKTVSFTIDDQPQKLKLLKAGISSLLTEKQPAVNLSHGCHTIKIEVK